MTVRFIPCAACARHVRETDSACPFCGAATPPPAPLPVPARARLSRSALIAAGIAGSLAATECASGTDQPAYGASIILGDGDASHDTADAQVGPPGDGSTADAETKDASADATADAPSDAGEATASDAGGDQGEAGRDGGPFQVLYGAFAPDR